MPTLSMKLVLEVDIKVDSLEFGKLGHETDYIDILEKFLFPDFKRGEEKPSSLPMVYNHRTTFGLFQEPLAILRIVGAKRYIEK